MAWPRKLGQRVRPKEDSARVPITNRLFVRSTLGLLLVGLVALAAIVATAFWLGVRTNAGFDSVLAARALRAATIDMRGSLQDAETSQRGFLLTGRDPYLQPYEMAIAAIPGQVAHLDKLIGDDAALKAPWVDAKEAISAKLAELAQTITLKQNNQAAAALAIVNDDKGKQLMDRARSDLGKVIDLEEERISAAVADQQSSTRALGWVAVIAAIVIVVVVGGSTWTVFRYTGELQAAGAELNALNAGLEQRVAERTADLVAANEETERFAYVVTHDLRAPLVNIMGFTAELEASIAQIKAYLDELGDASANPLAAEAHKATDADLPEAIGFIRSSTRKMDGLINAILKLAREGGRKMRPESVALDRLLENSVDAIRHQVTAADGEVVFKDKAPPIVTDRLALEQVLGNLLDNAVKYRAPERPLRIEIAARQAGRDRIEIEIADNGRGIAAEDAQRVFELFRRAGLQDQPGEGIGLAYVRRVLRNLGGDISMRSEIDKGTTFTVKLPRTYQPLPGR